jgi:phage recombination protein Bet
MGAIEISTPREFSASEMSVIKDVIARGASDTELKMFIAMAQKLGLDPLSKQIHCVKRRARLADGSYGDAMTIVVGIDGYRLVADRTQRYCPGKAPTYEYDDDGRVTSATAYVLKLAGGAWHEVSAIAFWDEYAQTNKDGQPTAMWAKMPRLMLAKCAEALVLRRAFPAELSGVYTDDEMQQAGNEASVIAKPFATSAADEAVAARWSIAALPDWKRDLIALGTRAKQAAAIMTPEEQQVANAALDMAREVLKRNGNSTQEERDAATNALKQALGE